MSKNAIISVYNKKHLDTLVLHLVQQGYTIYSTGGTLCYIKQLLGNNSRDRVISIEEYTEYPEICNGRVKTLHPKIHGGILGLRDNNHHLTDLGNINAVFFDLICVNLYPFEQTLIDTDDEAVILENIDIGGQTLLRAGAKNYNHVDVLCDPKQYQDYVNGKLSSKQLAQVAFYHVMKYDQAINDWFNQTPVRYGLNPHMTPCYFVNNNLPYQILNGSPSYINLLDAWYAISLTLEVHQTLGKHCCASYKHNSPAGVAIDKENITGAAIFTRAREVDPKSSFGDMIGYSGIVDLEMANAIRPYVSDGIIASGYTEEALEILRRKKKGKYLIMQQSELYRGPVRRDVNGVTIVQPSDTGHLDLSECLAPDDVKNDMILGYITLKNTQSNSVCFVYNGIVIGIGAGQQNRVDCIKIAGDKANEWFLRNNILNRKLILVSDAFLPFTDNVDTAQRYSTRYILQPGGSIRDAEIINACNNYHINMFCTGTRAFTH